MTPNDRSLPDPAEGDATADARLQDLLRSLPPPAEAADLAALNALILAQWQERHGQPALQSDGAGPVSVLTTQRGVRTRWLVATTGLAAGIAVVLGLWLQGPDPSIEDLLQPDVLSQMAAGEM